jgi:hypothetical protein
VHHTTSCSESSDRTFLASGVSSPQIFRQNNFHALKFLRKFFLSAKNSRQKNFKAKKNTAEKFSGAKIFRFDLTEKGLLNVGLQRERFSGLGEFFRKLFFVPKNFTA